MKKLTYIMVILLLLSSALRAQDSITYVNRLNQKAILSKDSCLFFAKKAWQISARLQYRKGKTDALKAAAQGKVLEDLLEVKPETNYLDYFIREQALKEWTLSNKVQQEKIEKANMLKQQRLLLISFLSVVLLLLAGFTLIRYRSYRTLRQQELMLRGMNAMISEKNKQLQTNDDFKNKLISVIAHDFREPLENIIRVGGMFRENNEQAILQEMITEVETSSRNTLVIFDNILRWIKSQLSGFIYTPTPCNLSEFFEGLPVQLAVHESLVLAGEPEMLHFVNRSLVYFFPEGQFIVVTAVKEADRVKVILTAKVPALQDAAGLFENGISLTFVICKDFMDKMGGQIWAEKDGTKLLIIYTLPSFH